MKQAGERAKSGERKQVSQDTTPKPKTLPELGVTRDQSSKWQKLAEIPEPQLRKRCAQIRIRAERRAGELLREMKETEKRSGKHSRGGGDQSTPRELRSSTSPTLEELGVTKKLSAEAQALHTIAEEQPEQVEAIVGAQEVGNAGTPRSQAGRGERSGRAAV